MQTITTIGFGDITPESTFERIYAIFCMGLGVVIYSFSIGNFSNYLINLNFAKNELNEKINFFNDFSLKFKLDSSLKNKIHEFLM